VQPATNLYVVGRNGNVLVVDFHKRPEPPVPRFPGAAGLRAAGSDEPEQVFDIVAASRNYQSPLRRFRALSHVTVQVQQQ